MKCQHVHRIRELLAFQEETGQLESFPGGLTVPDQLIVIGDSLGYQLSFICGNRAPRSARKLLGLTHKVAT